MQIDRDAFYDAIRESLFRGRLKRTEVEGMDAILDGWERDFPGGDPDWLAYALGTTFHETARTMRPIEEFGKPAYFERRYGVAGDDPERARRMGHTRPGDGHRYRGRGFVQLTWKVNYAAMEAFLAKRGRTARLVDHPDLAKDPGVATDILLHGMARGLFTGRRFAHYFDPATGRRDWRGARAIVNGRDRAGDVARHAEAFRAALDR